MKESVAVIGAGPMGLAAAYDLAKQGFDVTVFEAGPEPGGMSVSIDFDGDRIERFYHFVCGGDQPLFTILDELGLRHKLQWRKTSMGYYIHDKLHDWGTAFALLKFPHINLIQKFRYGLLAFTSVKRRNWRRLDDVNAVEWLKLWLGKSGYDILWQRLFDYKFHHFTDNLSAAWIWARLRRMGESRTKLLQEQLGFLEGGSETLIKGLVTAIEAKGGRLQLSSPVKRIHVQEQTAAGAKKVSGVEIAGQAIQKFDRVISTVPLPYVPAMLPDLPNKIRHQYEALNNIACVCIIVKLAKPLSKHFWLNVCDEDMDIPGLVEYTNLRELSQHIVYVPYYLPGDHPTYLEDDAVFLQKVKTYLQRINPELGDEDILKLQAGRYRFAQPICEPSFLNNLPAITGPIEGLYIADTSHYYPEDRSMSESVKLGRELAAMQVAAQEA